MFAHYIVSMLAPPVSAPPSGPTTTPSFGAAGAGATGTAASLNVPYPASIGAGDVLLLQVMVRNASNGAPNTPDGWTLLAGPHSSGTPTSRQWIFGKVASGSESGDLAMTFAAGTIRRTARMYRIDDAANVSVEDVDTTASTIPDVSMPSVTADGDHRLALAFVAADDDVAIAASTGESGGDWTEPVAEYLGGANSMLQLQVAALDDGGTISGGTAVAAEIQDWVVSSFALVGV